ncbi:DUF6063 family protein [Tindallia californiensis]|uniref:Non-ribosomal peptide synthetase module n=1 Tax=Tindallia californiensis TaxID=159292 RepID=A0A1H3QQ73_9FIRM|nr:DUF6063 family protein [Tindallia californiensis]SDZ15490.1 hypothetical protein SAMN05192546_11048 [Tindallia californiensis]
MEHKVIMDAFRLFSHLTLKGEAGREEQRRYLAEEDLKALVDDFAEEVSSLVLVSGEGLYLVPKTVESVHHLSNEKMKELYLPKRATNEDLYLMYVAILVFFGQFYDSYQTTEPTRDFLSMEDWLDAMNQRLDSLASMEEDQLRWHELDQQINWLAVLRKWGALDDLNEKVKVQDAKTNSRMSFLNSVRGFLLEQKLVLDIGNKELELTEKARTIVQRYYMDVEYNRNLLEFMFQLSEERNQQQNRQEGQQEEGREEDASHLEGENDQYTV